MCLIAFNWQPQQKTKLVLIANRDEFHARPTRALHWWNWPDGVIAGRDEQAGGTWLAANRAGRFAAITNFRQPDAPVGERSRGELPLAWMQHTGPIETFLDRLDANKPSYSPFSLLVGQVSAQNAQLWLIGTHESLHAIAPGAHALSNARLDAPWPKALRIRRRLEEQLAQTGPSEPQAQVADLLDLLDDRIVAEDDALPDTGVGLEMERFLSSPMIVNERYGTRSASVLCIGNDVQMAERSFDADGTIIGQRQFGCQRSRA